LLSNVSIPQQPSQIPSLSLDGVPVVFTPRDHAWLAPDQIFVASEVTFEQLASGSYWRQLSSSRELIAALRNPSLDLGSDARVMIHARVVQPLLDVALFLLGLPLVLSREQRNVFVASGLCVALVATFFVVVLACHVLGGSYLVSPVLGAWLPLMIFGPLAYVFAAPLWK
jgi:lipopolysaccharide export system permease protein